MTTAEANVLSIAIRLRHQGLPFYDSLLAELFEAVKKMEQRFVVRDTGLSCYDIVDQRSSKTVAVAYTRTTADHIAGFLEKETW